MHDASPAFFRGAPFALTASREAAACWAGRADVRSRLDKILPRMLEREESSLDMVWANLGAGKSHALHYLARRLADAGAARGIAAYAEMPDQPKRFLDLYRHVAPEVCNT